MRSVLANRWHRTIGLGSFLALVLALIGVGVVSGATHLPGAPEVVRQHDFGAWSYVARHETTGSLSAETHFDYSSVSAIRAFAATNIILAGQLASTKGQSDVQVTFKVPLSPTAYRTWITSADSIVVSASYIKAQDGRNLVGVPTESLPPLQITIVPGTDSQVSSGGPPPVSKSSNLAQGFPASSDPLPQAQLDRAVQNASQSFGAIKVLGVYACQLRVANQLLPALAMDPQVLIADVTAPIVRNDLQAAGVPDADKAEIYTGMPTFTVQDLMSQTGP